MCEYGNIDTATRSMYTHLNMSFGGTSERINDELDNGLQWQVFRELGSRSWSLILEIYLKLMTIRFSQGTRIQKKLGPRR